ncbi:hypothetical protein [Chenggangzhangella methanolivorans]|uniref:Uncharacterized protein n=1 Tax=Chenggangzhangella methanolivorans TaxID=1437009 RepID=A0A9E6RDM6_9HYPH|nr:hypothetical protein [Chenggangzhangella methanolivorans]QZO01408.1 hypothetical protein K6K41_08125 [Chenggangzhangella methanolivorans]
MGKPADTRKKFKTRWYHRHPKYWFRKDRVRPAGHRSAPEVVRLDPEPGVTPSDKPPVRIFLGTEPLQARAERVFVWSVRKHRDPARAYEIHLMKDLIGFDRTGWTTGFTNYRFAIPALAHSKGRGIYNDVDQIYLADPSELFDLDMGDASVLCIEPGETSVALIDAPRMAPHWRVQDAQGGMKRDFFLEIMNGRGLLGLMGPEWNSRDNEFTADRSKCFHFTTLRTQPWQPFRDQLRYEPHPDGEVWYALEREADAARFNSFTRERPGSGFAAAIARASNGAPAAAGSERRHQSEVAKLIAGTGAKTVLDYSAVAPDGAARSFRGAETSARPAGALFAKPVSGSFDGVAAIDALSGVPEEDVPWALDELFGAARRFVYVAVAIDAARMTGGAAPLPPEWWRLQMELAANRNPGLRWTLLTADGSGLSSIQVHGGAPSVAAAA